MKIQSAYENNFSNQQPLHQADIISQQQAMLMTTPKQNILTRNAFGESLNLSASYLQQHILKPTPIETFYSSQPQQNYPQNMEISQRHSFPSQQKQQGMQINQQDQIQNSINYPQQNNSRKSSMISNQVKNLQIYLKFF